MFRKLILFTLHKLAVRVAKATIDPDLKRAMPFIYGDLDREMPAMLRHGTSRTVEMAILDSVKENVNEVNFTDLRDLVAQTVLMYNPIKGALRG